METINEESIKKILFDIHCWREAYIGAMYWASRKERVIGIKVFNFVPYRRFELCLI